MFWEKIKNTLGHISSRRNSENRFDHDPDQKEEEISKKRKNPGKAHEETESDISLGNN